MLRKAVEIHHLALSLSYFGLADGAGFEPARSQELTLLGAPRRPPASYSCSVYHIRHILLLFVPSFRHSVHLLVYSEPSTIARPDNLVSGMLRYYYFTVTLRILTSSTLLRLPRRCVGFLRSQDKIRTCITSLFLTDNRTAIVYQFRHLTK